MNRFLKLVLHETRTLLYSPSSYVAGVVFLLLMGLLYFEMIWAYSQEPLEELPAEHFLGSFWLPVWFLVPLLTMRSISEERRHGTLETLMTTPVGAGEIVISKFLACYLFYCMLWGITLVFPWLAALYVSDSVGAAFLIDIPSHTGGYLFVAVSGLLFIAVGILSSSLTRSQLVAGMLSFSMLFFITVGANLFNGQNLPWLQWIETPLEYLRIFKHLEDFTRGIIDTRPMLFYISNTLLMLGISTLVAESRA